MPVDFKDLENKSFLVEEIAERMELTPAAIRRYVREGKLRAVRPPGVRAFRILGEDAIRFLKGLPALPYNEGDEG